MTIGTSPFAATVDFGADGKHYGHVLFPHSRDESGWGTLMLPIVSVKNGTGPTVLFTAGNHGDEYEGQVALMKLARALDPAAVQGQVIMIPALNLPAALAHSRVSPVDGGNMNRTFPGDPRGGLTAKIASYVQSELLPRIDAAVDLHSGGKSLHFVPLAMIHHLEDPDHFQRSLAALKAFAAPISIVLIELDMVGMLDSEVENLGKIFISTELGGSGALTPETVAVADRGLRNTLKHFGIIEGEPELPATPSRMMETPDQGAVIMCRGDGLFEPFVALGDEVGPGQAVGLLHFQAEPEREPVVHSAEIAGTIICRRGQGPSTIGDFLFMIAQDIPG